MTDKVGRVSLEILYLTSLLSADTSVQFTLDSSRMYHFGFGESSPEQNRSTDVPFKAQMRLGFPKTPSAEMSLNQNLEAYR